MTHQQFIALLGLYVIVVGFNFLSGRFSSLPEHAVKAKPNREEILSQQSRLYLAVFTATNVLVVGCGIAGVLGMFLFWHVAPWVFVGGVLGKILLFRTLFWSVKTGLEGMLSEIELFLDGVILTLVFVGPARHLFFIT